MYREMPARIDDVAAMEKGILDFWRQEDIFRKSLAKTSGAQRWVFYEGPPTANGTPGTHHVEARVFKDVFPRHRTMKGYHVPRRAGWDCHGLPVELAVEKELGFSGKEDIEEYGVAAFNAKCRESVLRHVDQFEAMTHRMGYWVDLDAAYWTMDSSYVESVWWSIKEIFDKGLLVQDHRVAPYCPRCGTGLSDHELAQGYETVVDPSVYVRFPVLDAKWQERFPGLNLLVWTTTPWTLVSNTAVAAKPDAEYVVVRTTDGEVLLVAAALADRVVADTATELARFRGSELERIRYQPPFSLVDVPDAHYITNGEYVTTDDGTGLVHIAPAFGADDLAVARDYDLPVVNPVLPDGHFRPDLPLVGGVFFKKADAQLVADLDERGLLFAHVPYEHAYPHCWRCHTPLLYYAQPSWYIRTTAIKTELLNQNENTNWYPESIKWGRYGDWLNNNVDWALSRDRYWGTPLPIWRCPDAHMVAVGSLAELSELSGRDLSSLDPHRPFVDEVTIPCPDCSGTASRVPEVIDCWYDSGAMPFAQWGYRPLPHEVGEKGEGYPHRQRSEFSESYPADFICEAIDQTRGWFYTLMAIGTLVFNQSPYRNVLCLGHILDEEGRKMSKHLGNVLDPIPLMDEHGADAVRWFMLASGSPWQARRVGHKAIAEVGRKTFATYWSTVSFQVLYARASGWDPASADQAPPVSQRHVLDRWALARAHRMTAEVDAALERFDSQSAGRELACFIDDLSNWYVRRSRRRFWVGDPASLSTLHDCLRLLTLAMAPLAPFITERLWQDLFRLPGHPESVHLALWPEVDRSALDDELIAHMRLVRRLVELGRTARGESGIGTRQPLRTALIGAAGWHDLPDELRAQVAEELNCVGIGALSDAGQDLVRTTIKPNFRSLGQRFSKDTQAVANAIRSSDPAALANALQTSGQAEVSVESLGPVAITADDVITTETPLEGWAVASSDGDTVALDLRLTGDLIRAGVARYFIRMAQEARKSSGLDVSDRITLVWNSDDPTVAASVDEHRENISAEVLATDLKQGTCEGPGFPSTEPEFTIWVQRQ
ncbi:MAG: isoleucine--tRNA ligase [Candidatus Nanopelagicales bacterium]|nr:isoleucine--tRNA ligase [Candidatus Nanopelagicales bacterium]MDZ4248510.1 isoleucine--tRNA ligase [Candidatus Nanopelagicales bacterium]